MEFNHICMKKIYVLYWIFRHTADIFVKIGFTENILSLPL